MKKTKKAISHKPAEVDTSAQTVSSFNVGDTVFERQYETITKVEGFIGSLVILANGHRVHPTWIELRQPTPSQEPQTAQKKPVQELKRHVHMVTWDGNAGIGYIDSQIDDGPVMRDLYVICKASPYHVTWQKMDVTVHGVRMQMPYCVTMNAKSATHCMCKGFETHKTCRHTSATNALVANGSLGA